MLQKINDFFKKWGGVCTIVSLSLAGIGFWRAYTLTEEQRSFIGFLNKIQPDITDIHDKSQIALESTEKQRIDESLIVIQIKIERIMQAIKIYNYMIVKK